MDFFKKLSDPVYFSRFSSRFTIIISIISFFLFGYLMYISAQNGRSIACLVFALIILMGINNMVKAVKMLKRLKRIER